MDTSDMRRALLMAARRHPELLKGLKTTVRIDSMPCRAAKEEARRRFPGVSIVWAEVQP